MSAQAPPPYSRVDPTLIDQDPAPSHPRVTRNGISPQQRRSMEDEARPLPDGWIRQFDLQNSHHFYVDTKANPPRSIWQHPYDDQQFVASLPTAEREHIEGLTRHSSFHDVVAEDSDDDEIHAARKVTRTDVATPGSSGARQTNGSNQSDMSEDKVGAVHLWGRKMKDKITQTSHEQREHDRQQRERDEQKAYETHLAIRSAISKAMETGQPQFIGKDRDGKDVYVEPPGGRGGHNYGGGYGYNPYAADSAYRNPNARIIRPADPYSRPYGYGYGGGYGLPLAGGLAGGMMLGGLYGGGLGGGLGGGFGGGGFGGGDFGGGGFGF